MDRWTPEEAQAWWSAQPWVCGFNFLPSTAVNFIEMWRAETFDKATIERELGWAADIGFNSFRINLHYLVWKNDRDGILERLDWISDVAHGLGISTVPCLFDDCGFGGGEPHYGPQPEPVPGVHNSRAVASPGRGLLLEGSEHSELEAYVKDIVRSFCKDRRILFWDLYNEPGNRMIFTTSQSQIYEPDFTTASLDLLKSSFSWCRSIGPEQPLSVAAWTTPPPQSNDAAYQTEIDQTALNLSDVVTFHAYWDTEHVARFIDDLGKHNRPMMCTEWMARAVGSRIEDQLELFQSRKVGCFQWGLVQGRTQTHLPWPADLVAAHGGLSDDSVWFHDLLDGRGTPYDSRETQKVLQLTESAI